jgi:hypothetical protein
LYSASSCVFRIDRWAVACHAGNWVGGN